MSLHRSLFTWFTLLVFLVLLVLRLDHRTQWNWFVVFIPVWIFNAILFIYSIFDIVSLCKSRGVYTYQEVFIQLYVSSAIILKVAFEIMLCLKLESPTLNLPAVYVLLPLWITLPAMALDIFATLVNKAVMKKEFRNLLKLSIFITPCLISLLWFYISSNNTSDTDNYPVRDSSVWCRDSGTSSKLCKLKNVCYDPNLMSVLFFLGNLSVIKGLSNYQELQGIQLSSVSFHNKFEANITTVDVNHKILSFDHIKKALVFSRFKPDNIMHVIHDDLIPLYLTLEDICLGDVTCQQSYTLVLHDPYSKGLFHNLYVMFSDLELILLSEVSKPLCFDELHMGLVKDSVFYEYGFDRPQGPVKNIKLQSNDLLRFTSFVRRKLSIKAEDGGNRVVLVTRKKTRKILNENNVIRMLENVFQDYYQSKVEVLCLDLHTNDTSAFIKEASGAAAFVGMHGAEMIFSIFLKSNATVVELFPYAIKPHVSFVKPLANIKDIYFNYVYWENIDKNNSVSHPHADPLHGGISHLPVDTQKYIQSVKEVEPVYCCNEPVYLYYMYQDTLFDFNFQNFLTEKLYSSPKKDANTESEWFYPSPVIRIGCYHNPTGNFININWSAPFNVRVDEVFYDVFILSKYIKKNIITEDTNLVIEVANIGPGLKIQTWITSVIKTSKTRSKDVFIECNIS